MATVRLPLGVGAFAPSPTVGAFPEEINDPGTNFAARGLAFDASTAEDTYTRFRADNFGSGNVLVIVDWYSRTAQTSGGVVLAAAFSVLPPGDAQSILTDAFATENTQATTVSGTARALNRTTITVSNLDSLAAGDSGELRRGRRPANGSDTMTGDAVVVDVNVEYSDT